MEDDRNITDSKLSRLRRSHPQFIYEGFSIATAGDDLELRYRFRLEPDIQFEPETTIKAIGQSRIASLDSRLLERLVFHLGLVEMLSYWKAACSPEIVVKAGPLNVDQIAWWEDLILHGMGEFFFVNRIDFNQPGFVKITADRGGNDEASKDADMPRDRYLVLASGGKDTALTLQLLQEGAARFNCLMLNPVQAAADIVAEAGCRRPLIVSRSIDSRLLELNGLGYLNGHTPFSAYLSFLGVACAVLFGYDRAVASNERSSNEGNVEFLGSSVNHQYSKTFRFEEAFRRYCRDHLSKGVEYLSFLRPLYEIQIIRLFSDYPRYFQLFKSCNRNLRENSWCGRCPKCVSVYTLFYPFLSREDLLRVFGSDFFEGEEAIPLLKALAGFEGHKPFECVGTTEETIAALYLGVQKARAGGTGIPAGLRFASDSILPLHANAAALGRSVLSAWSDDHNLPAQYERLIREKLELINSR